MSNKKLGNDFERVFCEKLAGYGFWVHNMAQNRDGQPADVIAVRNGKAYLIDCKVCSNWSFDLSRVEDNQKLAMALWKDCGNNDCWFAMLLPSDEIIMVSTNVVRTLLKRDVKSIDSNNMLIYGMDLEKWVTYVN